MAVVVICFFLLLLHGHTSAQVVTGEFPQPSTVSLLKPVSATSTCGEEEETFCQYTSDVAASLSPNCMSAICDKMCLYSSSSPSSIDLTGLGTQGGGVTTSLVTGPGDTTVIEFSNSFISIPSSSVPQISANGFTFAVWMKQNNSNDGALISKASSDGLDRTYSVSVTETSVVFDYLPSNAESGFSTLVFSDLDLLSSFWHHVAVTVFEDDFALYINGTIEQASGLIAAIDDSSTDTVHLGQIAPSLNHYNGLMQDVYFFSQALTAREIEELATGEFPYNHLQSECRCPPSHPVINSVSSGLCIQHTGTVTDKGSETRLNSQSHTVGYANDNNFFTTWISGINVQQSNLTMSFTLGSNSAFELIFIFVRYASPAPKAAVLEKSIDGGKTFIPIQYFSDDCNSYFGLENNAPLQSNDDVNCITEYSNQIPTTGVTARIRFADGSRGELSDSNEELQNFILSDHIRLRMVDYYTMNTTAQHRYYGISDITVAARCACNGHAPRCSSDITSVCDCVHNTQGDRCEECLPLYNDKPWRKGTSDIGYPCKICDCNNHATVCHYNETIDPFPTSYDLGGGGVCDGCQDNTAGTNCETCDVSYYRKAGVDPSDSQPCSQCDCNNVGSIGEDCVKHEGIPGQIAGQCNCKTNVEGLTCSQCKDGFFNLVSSNSEGCQSCDCNTDGTVDGINTCNTVTGQCVCKLNVVGLKCDQCVNGTQGLTDSDPNGCSSCICNVVGSIDQLCDSNTGQCSCKPGVMGISCDQCIDGYYGFSQNGCQECECSAIGSNSPICNVDNGVCSCLPGFTGQNCDQCSIGFFFSSETCTSCQCNENGTVSSEINNCDMTGQCLCKENVIGQTCDTCAPNYANLQLTGCNECDCTLTNTNTSGILCNPVTSQCACLPSAGGLKCDSCLEGHYPNTDQACLECNCNTNGGAISIDCSPLTGQCFCTNGNITGLACDQCTVGHYDFPNCFACQCNIAGSINSVCDSETGECQCKEFVTGMNCDTCKEGYETLEALNPFGCSTDPEEQSPPIPSLILSRSILISWLPPEKPNGVIALYGIIRNNTLIDSVPGSVLSFNDTGLIPNTVYIYQVESENIAGSTLSEGITITTLEGAPEQVNPPVLTVINSTSLRADWSPPNITNGVITNYNLLLVSVDNVVLESSVVQFSGLALTYTVTGLTPFTVNTFVLEACTKEECGSSIETSGTTAEAVPAFQTPPTLTVINSTIITVNWVEPAQPNGIIVKYEIYIRSSPFVGDGLLIGVVSGDVSFFTIDTLQPFVEYEFSVASFTSAGGKRSEWTREMTEEAVPESLIDPIVIPVSSNELQVQWSEPATPNGIILLYQIFIRYLNNSQDDVVNSTSIGNYTESGLSPFTSYGFFVMVCNTAGCASSNIVYNTTLESAPTGLQSPTFSAIYSRSIEIDWQSPENPNGIITQYSVTRSIPSLQSSPAKRNIGTSFYGVDFASYPPAIGDLEGFFITISLMFKTLRPDGILVYSINNARTDMIAIELRDGIPWFVYDAGSGPAVFTLDDEDTKYNDGKWHELVAARSGGIGDITIDGVATGMGVSIGDDHFIGAPDVLYIGGLENDAALTTITGDSNVNATLNGYSFAGCLFGVKFNENYLNFSTLINPNPGVGSSSKGCPIEREYGMSFIGGGYLSMPYIPPTTDPFSFSVWFRTTRSSSLLFFAYGSDSYIAVMLQDSDLVVRIKGVNSNEITAKISLQSNLCNGQWYNLAMSKESDGFLVTIANQSISNSIDNNININTTSNFYIGGVPVSSEAWNAYYNLFLTYPIAFSGCMRNFIMDGISINLHQDFGDSLQHVRFDGCDSSSLEDSQLCSQDMTSFNTNLETMFTDSGLTPFTEYLYQVSAENSVGQTFSSWSLDMTAEDSPEELDVVAVISSTSSSFMVNWSQQQTANGIITGYEVIATPITTVGLDSPNGTIQSSLLNIESPIQELTVEVVELEPASNYSIVLRAYTGAGFGTGPPIYEFTLEDIPVDVQTPVVINRISTEVTLEWTQPTQPNGVIIIYRVYIADAFIETTGMTVIAKSLEPFTTYEFILEACTQVGCMNSSSASVTTTEGVPIGLDPPSLLSLSSSIVQASWTIPSEPNGIIAYYELFRVFGDELSQTELVANTTELVASVSGLLPSTLYYFRLIAYNSFGSASSNISSITTPEDTPEQIIPPDVAVVNSSSLLVTWQEPLQPNGVITNYTIFRNSASVFIEYNMNYTFLDTDLMPFTTYTYFILVCTAKGCGASQTTSQTTEEAIPESIQQPDVVSVASNSAMVNIKPVDKPNGNVRYILRVSGEFLLGYSNDSRQTIVETRVVFNETEPSQLSIIDLLPFTSYSMWIEVTNNAGSAFGDVIFFTTLSAAPEILFSPQVALVSSIVLNITWSPPVYPNGNITEYIITLNTIVSNVLQTQSDAYTPTTNSALVFDLEPFSEYNVFVTAVNVAGNITSEEAVIMTGETAPTDFDKPTVSSTTSYSIAVSWDPPSTPNGVILNYTITTRLSDSYEIVDEFTVQVSISQYNSTELMPFTGYDITIETCNSAGCKDSPSITAVTDEAAPELVATPSFSTSPNAVTVYWEEPAEKNGIILLYTIYRAIIGGTFSVLDSIAVDNEEQVLQYIDNTVEPFTTYQYYIEASNSAGSNRGNSSSVLTEQTAPENVLEPLLEAVSSSMIIITIVPPLNPNGIITKYIIGRYTTPSNILYIEVSGPNNSYQNVSYTDTKLDPYTVYVYFITAFTVAGNMTGNTSMIQTLEAPPTNLSPPNILLNGDTSILIGWQPPLEENGVITSYQLVRGSFGHYVDENTTELYKTMLASCCESNLNGLNSDSSGIVSNDDCVLITETDGDTTSYIDSNLDFYTYYGYCIGAYNGAGGIVSPSSNLLQTSPAPQPLSGPNVTAIPINSTAIIVSWTTPDLAVLLGPLTSFTLYGKEAGETGQGSVLVSSLDQEYIASGLTPSTTYTFVVEVDNSRGTALGMPINVTTLDGIPIGVQDPIVLTTSATSILITWAEPLTPNGEIIRYSIFINSELHHNQSTPGSLSVTGLKPFTMYVVRLEACTVLGCAKSGLSSNKTFEAAPTGLASPTVVIQSPYDATIFWNLPLQPNGIITQYNLYVRELVECFDGFCFERNLVFSGLAFNYTVNDLTPATQYGFEVVAINGGGNVSSGFTTETTQEAPPTFVAPPDVITVSAYAIRIEWEVPIEPNGLIIGYTIYRDDVAVGVVLNMLVYTDTSLSPFTDYSYMIEACTSAGCTNSTATMNATFEAKPDDFIDPIITNVTSDSLVISWFEPLSPNGIIINYLVSFANGTIIFASVSDFPTVNGLSPFTNYSFIVTACNSVDCLDSNTVTIATLEAPPSNISAPSIKDLSSMSVEVSWKSPSQTNGLITTYRLRRDGIVIFDGLAFVYDDESLEGDTQYVYTIEAVNSVGSALSPSIVIHTQADIPSNIATPTTTVLNSTAIYVEWKEPESSNGDITAYKLFVNDEEILSSGFQLNHTIGSLSPFTQYTFYVQVCNQVGCASSKSVTNTTEEDLPVNLAAPFLTAISAATVLVSWSEPDMPNGAITTYRVLRRRTDSPLLILIQYVGGPDITSFTNQDLDPYTSYEYQVVVFNSKGSTTSPWTEVTTLEAPPTDFGAPTFPIVQSTYLIVSWEEPASPNGILIQYEVLYRPLLGELILFQTVQPNVTQVNVTGLTPFTLYELRIIVSNNAGEMESDFGNIQTLEDAPKGLGDLILVTKTSESLTLTWNEPSQPNGVISEYVLYLNGIEEYRDALNIATIDRLKPFTGYSLQLEACTLAACSTGKIFGFTTSESPPMGQLPPTVILIDTKSVMITWDFPTQPNGIIKSYEIFRLEVLEPIVDNSTDDLILVYTTMDVSNRVFNDTMLTPDTGYLYAIRANNSVGLFLSGYSYIQTPQAAPESVQSPVLEVLGTDSIGITWDPPNQDNGELTQYQIYRNTDMNNDANKVYTGLNREFTDTGLKPYTQYRYTVEACTIAGCTNSSTTNATTDQSIPESINTPVTTALSSSSISVTWTPPDTPNGEITLYKINVIAPVSINITLGSSVLTTIITSLEPYTLYTVIVEACTVVGCVSSDSDTVTTLESFPVSQGSPSVIALGPSSVDVFWTKPGKPNGIIINYILRRNNTIVYEGSETSFIDNDLLPNQKYAYDVQSFTSIGGGERSLSSIVITNSDTPSGIDPPILLPLDSTSILATWAVPNVTNGDIQKYILYVNGTVVYENSVLGFVVSDLSIFTTYQFRVEACTSTCGSSLYSYTTTKEDIPSGQLPPTLTLSTNQTVLVTWLPPSTPNGIILTYSVERAQVINDELGAVMVVAEDIPAVVEELLDSNSSLAPATTYNYRITASNSVGSATSQYSSITLPDGVPQNLSAPLLVAKTSTSLTVSVNPPEVANGVLTQYTLFGDNLFPIIELPSSQTEPVTFTHTNLDPFTSYRVYAEVCTVGGCVLGLASTFMTDEDVPEGLLAPFVTTETPRKIRIEWSTPSKPNGIITGYKLFYKLPCPQPAVSSTITSLCTEIDYRLLVSTTNMIYSFDSTATLLEDPFPYTSYQFKLQAENIAGTVNSTDTEVITTAESVPEQINPLLFTVYNDNQSIALNWGSTFRINGQLKSYTVIRDGIFLLIGPQTYAVFPNQPINTVLQFSVRASNIDFQFTSSGIPLEINVVQVQSTVTMTTASPTVNTTMSSSDTNFYEGAAFIVGMVILAIIMCFVLLVIALCLVKPNRSTQSSDKYDTLRSEKGSPLREDGTVGSGWSHERMTPVPSYHDALRNYPTAADRRTLSSYSPVKSEMLSRDNSYSPQTKAELAAIYFQEELPLTDTRISRLSVHEDIPMKQLTPQQKQKHYELQRINESASEHHSQIEDMGVTTLKKNIPITSSQESMLDTKI